MRRSVGDSSLSFLSLPTVFTAVWCGSLAKEGGWGEMVLLGGQLVLMWSNEKNMCDIALLF